MFRSSPLSPGDRVVVRRLLSGQANHATDIIGHVVSTNPLVLRPQAVGGVPSSAPAVTIPDADIQALRRLSPRRIRNSDIRAVETAYARAFPGQERTLTDGWLTRAGSSIAERSNSATPVGHSAGFGAVPLDKIAFFYRSRNMPVQLLIPERIGAPALRLVEAAPEKWELGPEILTMTRDLELGDPELHEVPDEGLDDHEASPSSPGGAFEFRIDPQPDADWLSMYHFRGAPLPPEALQELSDEIEGELGFGRLVVVKRDGADAEAAEDAGRTVAVTRGTLTESDDGKVWLGYSAVEVAPDYRRRGLGTELGMRMLQWGADNGADGAYLQVLASNEAGIGLYTKLGFVEHHRHRYARQRDLG